MTWSNLFPPGTTWPAGSLGRNVSGVNKVIDPVTGTVATSPPDGSPTSYPSLYIANWLDGPGFNGLGGAPAPDLAINSPKNFKLIFTHGVTKIGLAMSTGMGNAPGQFDHSGAAYQLTTSNGDTGPLTLLDPGNGLAICLTVQSSKPFTSLTFFKTSGGPWDQYFGNIVTSATAVNPTPLPGALSLFATGLGVIGLLRRHKKRKDLQALESRGNFFSTRRTKRLAPIGNASSLKS
jgi:hypothetical protein